MRVCYHDFKNPKMLLKITKMTMKGKSVVSTKPLRMRLDRYGIV